MPKNRPSRVKRAVATKVTLQGAPCVELNYAGVAVKTAAVSWSAGLVNPASIAIAESFNIINKGEVEVASTIAGLAGAVKGDTVWINATNNALTLTDPGGGNGRQYGRVSELAGVRGGAANRLRIDLDAKDSF